MKPALLFLAFCALFYFVPFWVNLSIVLYGTLAMWLVMVLFMVFVDFFVGDK